MKIKDTPIPKAMAIAETLAMQMEVLSERNAERTENPELYAGKMENDLSKNKKWPYAF